MELIYFKGKIATRHKPTRLVDDARETQGKEEFHFFEGDFFFPLQARKPIVCGSAFDSEKTTISPTTDAHGTARIDRKITLCNTHLVSSSGLIVAND